MFNKIIALSLVLIALCTTAAWSLEAIDSDTACTDQLDSSKDSLELHGAAAPRQEPVAREDPRDGSTRELRFAYDEMFDESRSH